MASLCRLELWSLKPVDEVVIVDHISPSFTGSLHSLRVHHASAQLPDLYRPALSSAKSFSYTFGSLYGLSPFNFSTLPSVSTRHLRQITVTVEGVYFRAQSLEWLNRCPALVSLSFVLVHNSLLGNMVDILQLDPLQTLSVELPDLA